MMNYCFKYAAMSAKALIHFRQLKNVKHNETVVA